MRLQRGFVMLKKWNYNTNNKSVKSAITDAMTSVTCAAQNELAQVGHRLVQYAKVNRDVGLTQNQIATIFFAKSPQNISHLLKKYPYRE